MNEQQLINELLAIEASAELLRERACKARAALECVHTPAPKRGRLSQKKKMQLILNVRKNMSGRVVQKTITK